MSNLQRIFLPAGAAALLCAAIGLGGCTEVVVGGGATVAAASLDERGVGGVATDAAIVANVNALWIDFNADIPLHIDATVSEGRVLLTGTAPTQQMRLDAVRIAWRSPGVKAVINEIEVNKEGGLDSYARDAWITTQLVSQLTVDNRIKSFNYSIETVNHVVYLMGIAQDRDELERVRNHARQVRYVRHTRKSSGPLPPWGRARTRPSTWPTRRCFFPRWTAAMARSSPIGSIWRHWPRTWAQQRRAPRAT
jgi:osmotically-inducible protein OsmY